MLQPFHEQLLKTGRYQVLFAARMRSVGAIRLSGRPHGVSGKNRKVLSDFFEDHVRAMRWFNDPKNHDEAVKIVANFTKQKPEDLQYLFTKADYYRDPYLFPNVTGIQSMADACVTAGLMTEKLQVAPNYVDTSFVEEAKRRIEADAH